MKISLIDSGGHPSVIVNRLIGTPDNSATQYNPQPEQAKAEWVNNTLITEYKIKFQSANRRTSSKLPQIIQQRIATKIKWKRKFFRPCIGPTTLSTKLTISFLDYHVAD